MTKPIRALVHCRSVIDGRVSNEWDERRIIYFFKDGPYVSHLGNKRGRRAVANADGTYSVDYQVRTISKRTGIDVFGKPVKL